MEITLKELTQIALGAPEVTDVNVSVLHSLFDIILRKLNCEHELVSFEGMEASCLRKLLDMSKISPFYFNDDKILLFSDKFKHMDVLEQKTQDVEGKLQKHFESIKKCSEKMKLPAPAHKYPTYAHFCEDLLLWPDKGNELILHLLTNKQFLVKIMCMLGYPLVEKVLDLEKRVERLKADYIRVAEWSKKEYEHIYLIEECARDLEKVKDLFEASVEKFDNTMIELEHMLIAKLDKHHLAPLKLYIDTLLKEFDKIEEEEPHCPAVIKISPTEKCLGCGATPELRNRPYVPASGSSIKRETCDKSKQLPTTCGCRNMHKNQITLHDRIAQLDLVAVKQAVDMNICLKRMSRKLTTATFHFDPLPTHMSEFHHDQDTEMIKMHLNAAVLEYFGLDSIL